MIEDDGWFRVATRGSHRSYKHPVKKGRITIPGHFADDVHPKTLRSILVQAQIAR
jgi:predicted RNA binding protein YcfA (HicA-like mRNA interferase family)